MQWRLADIFQTDTGQAGLSDTEAMRNSWPLGNVGKITFTKNGRRYYIEKDKDDPLAYEIGEYIFTKE